MGVYPMHKDHIAMGDCPMHLVTGFLSWSQEFFPWSHDFCLGHRISFLGHRIFFLVNTGFILGPKKSVTGDRIHFFGADETCHR